MREGIYTGISVWNEEQVEEKKARRRKSKKKQGKKTRENKLARELLYETKRRWNIKKRV